MQATYSKRHVNLDENLPSFILKFSSETTYSKNVIYAILAVEVLVA